jgi:hypothetical protein
VPQPGQEDLRGFEWRYLWGLCQDGSKYIPSTMENRRVQQTTVKDEVR